MTKQQFEKLKNKWPNNSKTANSVAAAMSRVVWLTTLLLYVNRARFPIFSSIAPSPSASLTQYICSCCPNSRCWCCSRSNCWFCPCSNCCWCSSSNNQRRYPRSNEASATFPHSGRIGLGSYHGGQPEDFSEVTWGDCLYTNTHIYMYFRSIVPVSTFYCNRINFFLPQSGLLQDYLLVFRSSNDRSRTLLLISL